MLPNVHVPRTREVYKEKQSERGGKGDGEEGRREERREGRWGEGRGERRERDYVAPVLLKIDLNYRFFLKE